MSKEEILDFVKWTQINGIRLGVYSYKEIEKFIDKYLKKNVFKCAHCGECTIIGGDWV